MNSTLSPTTRTALVCDIDGTLAADAERRHLRPVVTPHCLGNLPTERIERYMAPELVALDQPIHGAARFLAAFAGWPLLIITARWDSLREITATWLSTHYAGLPYERLLMRRRGDCRPSAQVKLELVLAHCDAGFWLDDDPLVLALAAQHGFVPLEAPEIYRAEYRCSVERHILEGEFLRRKDPRARFLAATAPDRIPAGSVLCLCGPDEDCVLCREENQR